MTKNMRNGIILVSIVLVFIILSFMFNFKSVSKKVYSYDKGIINIEGKFYEKLYNEDFNYVNVNSENLEDIAYLNKNNYFKDNISIYSLSPDVIYIDQFQDYIDEREVYIYGGVYINKDSYDSFLNNFDYGVYHEDLKGEGKKLDDKYSSIIKNVILNKDDKRYYKGIKQDLSEYSYDINIPHKEYKDIFLKIRLYRTKGNDIVFKFKDNIYLINEFKDDDYISERVSYYTYRGDDYGYLYNKILSEEDLHSFAFHDDVIEKMDKDKFTNYVSDAFKILNNESISIKDKTLLIKEILYTKYKPNLREEFPLKIERIKNLNIINDNRKSYRINHNFLFKIFNYPADLYALAFYEDDLLYNIPERYKNVYENLVNLIINDKDLEYTLKNDMIVELQNKLVVVDEETLNSMREKYGEIEVLEESNERIKYAPGYYGFLFDEINSLEDLKEFSFHEEVMSNILDDFFKEKYIEEVNNILNSNEDLAKKISNVFRTQLNFTLIKIDKEKYYREKYNEEYFKESYINKIKKSL